MGLFGLVEGLPIGRRPVELPVVPTRGREVRLALSRSAEMLVVDVDPMDLRLIEMGRTKFITTIKILGEAVIASMEVHAHDPC